MKCLFKGCRGNNKDGECGAGVEAGCKDFIQGDDVFDSSQSTGSVSEFLNLFSCIKETKDPMADPDCCICEGLGFYHVLDVGEYDEQQTTVQCACKRKQNDKVSLNERSE